jgi:hypothetical protein
MPPRPSLPSTVPSVVASLVDTLAVAAGPLGAALILGDGALPMPLRPAVSLADTFPFATGVPAAWAASLVALSLLSAYALWTRRRWLVWTLAGVATVVALGGAVVFAPVAALLVVAAARRSHRASDRTADYPDVTL